jgi:hypothetical protein
MSTFTSLALVMIEDGTLTATAPSDHKSHCFPPSDALMS